MKNLKKITAILSAAALCILLAFTPVTDKKRIVIDAGHGGHDAGKATDDYAESTINLEIAKKIQELAQEQDIEVILLRDTDEFITLSDRADAINKLNPDVFISIHINSGLDGSLEMGNQMFIHDKASTKEKSLALAGKLMFALGEKTSFKESRIQAMNLAILRLTNSPGVLMNLGNIKNDKERNYVTSNEGQEAIARSIVTALAQ